MTYREHVIRGRVTSEHLVQVFDTPESLADTLASFVSDGLLQGSTVLVVCTPAHWSLASERIERQAGLVADATSSGQLTVLDAATTMKQFLRHGYLDSRLFDETVGALVHRLNERGARLLVYGEMVDLLATEGDYRAALRLEELWNTLGERESYTLFCGYQAVNFGDPRTGAALHEICRAHSRVHVNPIDRLGSWLLESKATDNQAPMGSIFEPPASTA